MDLKAAETYVSQHGDPADQGRLRYILTGERPPEAAIRQALATQRADGGWPPSWAPGYSSLDATCHRLAQAEQFGLGPDDPRVTQALRFLEERQQGDGAWEEKPEESSMAPPWARPGERDARLYLTANCGYWLARLSAPGMGSLRESAARGAEYLQTYLDSRGRLPSFWQAHWLAAGLWQILKRQDLADAIYIFLEGRVPEMPPSSLAWLIAAVRGAGLASSHSLVGAASKRLVDLQAQDGRWPSEEGAARDVNMTIDAVYAIRLAGLF